MLTVQLPGAGEAGPEQAPSRPGMPAGPGGGHSGCPQTQVGRMLGINIANPHGCIIGGVVPKGPAAEAGLLQGDSIVACNGVEVTCPASLLPELENARAQGSAELKVLRPASTDAGDREETPQAEAGGPQSEEPTAEPGQSGESNRQAGQ